MKFIDRTGETKKNKVGNLMKIINYKNATNMDVLFLDTGYISKNKAYKEFKNGNIKDLYNKNIFGVGFIGEGTYKTDNKMNNTWWHMLQRCYDKTTQEKQPTYIGCTVCEEWHNYQNFANWYDENYYEVDNQKMEIDKDILIKGNKVYSPETCVFVPKKINILFTKRSLSRGEFPIGVQLHSLNCKNKYGASCSNGTGKGVYLGLYLTPELAFEAYKIYKENLIRTLAEKYYGLIPEKLYNALMQYKVEITD